MRESDLPGQRAVAGEESPTLLTRSVERRTGRVYWLFTKATLLDEAARSRSTSSKTSPRPRPPSGASASSPRPARCSSRRATTSRRSRTSPRWSCPTLADWCALDLLDADGRLQRVALVHHDPEKRRLGDDLHKRYPPELDTDQGLAAVLRGGESVLVPEITEEMLASTTRDDEHLRLLSQLGMRSAMLIPLRIPERTIGVLSLVNADSHRTFDEGDLAFAEEVARRAASAVSNARAS